MSNPIKALDRTDLFLSNAIHKVMMINPDGSPFEGGIGGSGGTKIHVSTEKPTDDVGNDGDLWLEYKLDVKEEEPPVEEPPVEEPGTDPGVPVIDGYPDISGFVKSEDDFILIETSTGWKYINVFKSPMDERKIFTTDGGSVIEIDATVSYTGYDLIDGVWEYDMEYEDTMMATPKTIVYSTLPIYSYDIAEDTYTVFREADN